MSDVPEGFQWTDIGVIPDDWRVFKIREVCQLVNGRGFKPYEWASSGLPIIRIQNLNGSDDFNYYRGSYDKKIEVENGQLLFAWSGSRGTSFGPHVWRGSLGLLNYHTWKVRVNEAKIDHDFFFHSLRKLTEFIEGRAHGAAALVHTQKWEMEGFGFPSPKEKEEQQAIASALSDADALISSLEALLTKKRQLKQAAMQELLTGKTRLERFTGEWEEKELGEVADVIDPHPSHRAPPEVSSGIPFVGIGDFDETGNLVNLKVRRVSPAIKVEHETRYRLEDNLIGLGRVASIGKVVKLKNLGEPYTISPTLGVIRGREAKRDYLLHALKSKHITDQFTQIMSGSTRSSVGMEVLRKLKVLVPRSEEQDAIAGVFGDLDADIASLEERLAKTRGLKQGMMQELLTGRTRLI